MLHPLHCGWGQCCPYLAAFTAVRAGVTPIPCGQTGRCSYAAVLVDGTLLAAVLLLHGELAWLLPSPMLHGVEAHILLFAETQIYRYLQQGHHNNVSASIASLRVVPIPPPSPTPPPSAALITDNNQQHVYQ